MNAAKTSEKSEARCVMLRIFFRFAESIETKAGKLRRLPLNAQPCRPKAREPDHVRRRNTLKPDNEAINEHL